MKALVLDCDYDYNKLNEPVIRLYCKIVSGEDEGKDIVLHVLGMEPYFYIDNAGYDIYMLKKKVEEVLKGYVKRVEIVKRFGPIGYQTEKSDMLKIILFNPRTTPDARDILKKTIPGVTSRNIYEADILFKNRYMIDADINGFDVIQFNAEKISNYNLNCKELFICKMEDIHVLKDELVNIEY